MFSMFEESVESFTARWRSEAAQVHIFSRVENDPLLELEAAGVIFHALERTGPYLPTVGPGRVIVHAITDQVQMAETGVRRLEVTGISRAHIQGQVMKVAAPFLVVDAGFPVVTGLLTDDFPALRTGDFVSLEVLPPMQAFVLVESVRRVHDVEV